MKSTSAVRSDYPRAQPHCPPPAQQKAPVRLALSPWFTLGYFLLVIAAGLIAVLVTAMCFVRDKPQVTSSPPPALAPAVPLKPAPITTPMKIPAMNLSVPTSVPASAATLTDKTGPLLEAIGTLSAAQLYQSYLNIGFLADAVELDTYTEAEADKLLQAVQDMLATVDQQFARLDQLDLSAEDQRSLSRLRTIRVVLRTQARTLQAYWTSGDPDQLTRYHDARDQAWGLLQELN